MRFNVTDIYRIETMNSTYEIKVIEVEGELVSSCKKMGKDERAHQVRSEDLAYLKRLTIGASFDVPGVVITSIVTDYQHFVLSDEPKMTMKDRTDGIGEFFDGLANHLIRQVKGQVKRQ